MIVKIGGSVLDSPDSLGKFLLDFSSLQETKILVHGGGTVATKIGEQLGIESNYVNGRRITDAATRDLVTMVYGGLVNKQLVAKLNQLDCYALGMTGADGNVVKAVKRPVKDIDYGYVGDVNSDNVNVPLIQVLLLNDVIPVIAPLTSENGMMLNTNADTIASALAIALSEHYNVRLVFCFEKPGVLMDTSDENSIISHLSENTYKALLTLNVFSNGILPKLENAFSALHKGVKEIVLGDANNIIEISNNESVGTTITL